MRDAPLDQAKTRDAHTHQPGNRVKRTAVRLDRAGGGRTPDDSARLAGAGILAALVVVVAWDFLAATTFVGDDHLFLAFARLAPHPFGPFGTDCHGGEYYRPLPMALWWLLARLGGQRAWVFALFALALHTTAAALTAALARALGLGAKVATVAAALFLVAPAPREAALWFAASTDLLVTVTTLGSILCLLRGTRPASLASLGLAALAYLSKESALALPFLAAAALAASDAPKSERPPAHGRLAGAVARTLPHAALALVYAGVRFGVLRGIGGAGDDLAPLWGRALQIASGLVHALVGDRILPPAILWILGGVALLWGAAGVRQDRRLLMPLLWTLLSVLPLLAAGWVVGARYFYLPAVGLSLLVARQLWARGPAVTIVAVGFLLVLGSARAIERRAEIAVYRARVDAVADAVASGLSRGHRLFHVRGGIKDLDLVLKNRPGLRAHADELLILPDVPASFALIPPALTERTRFLLASPPLPPSGAYRFGPRSIVGLARRHESPDLEVVIARLPELRIIELSHRPNGARWRDVTDSKH
jgi:hypothetical protein